MRGQVDANFQQIAGSEESVNYGSDGMSVTYTIPQEITSVTFNAFYMQTPNSPRLCDDIGGEIGLGRQAPQEQAQLELTGVPQCIVTTGSSVNLRSGPGVNFERVGALNAGQTAQVLAQSTSDDGFLWWALLNASGQLVFAREDVVNASGDCANVQPLCNLRGSPSPAITDTQAFATCP